MKSRCMEPVGVARDGPAAVAPASALAHCQALVHYKVFLSAYRRTVKVT